MFALIYTIAANATCTAYTVDVDNGNESTPNFGMVKSFVI